MIYPRPTGIGRLAEIAYEGMRPVHKAYDAERNWPLLRFLDVYYLPLQLIDDIVRDTEYVDENGDTQVIPGWGILFDPDRCPARYLPFLAMFAGVRLRPGMTEAEIRSRIKTRDGLLRCRPAALIKAAQDNLEGEKRVILRERYDPFNASVDAPGYFQVITFTDDTPDSDAVKRALLEQKDVGLIMRYNVLDGQDWQSVIDDYDSWTELMAAYATWTDVIEDTP